MAKVVYSSGDFIDNDSFIQAMNEIGNALKSLDSSFSDFSKRLDKHLQENTKTIEKSKATIKQWQDVVANTPNASKNFAQTIQETTNAINEQNKAYKESAEQVKKSKKANEELEGSLNGLKQKYKEVIAEASKVDAGSEAFQNLTKEAQELDKEIKKLSAGFKAQKVIQEAAAGSYDELSRKTAALKRELKSLPDVFGANAEAAKRLKAEIAANDQKLKEFDSSIGESFRNVGNYASALDGVTGGLASTFAAGGAAAVGAAVFTKAIEIGIEKLGELIQAVQEANKELKQTESITGLTGQKLFEFTAGIQATAKTFGVEYTEVLRAANAASKEFGISQGEALRGVQELLARGGDINGNALDNIREYSTQVARAGVTYQQFVDLQAKSAKAGIFDDKLLDTIKEGQLRLGDLTKAQKEALATLGKDGDEVTKLFSEGKRFEAIQKLSQAIVKLEANGKNAQPIISNLFGGPGEDLGIKGFEIIASLEGVNKELTKAEKNTLALLKAQTKTNEQFNEFSSKFSNVGTTLSLAFEKIKTTILEDVNDILDAFITIGASFEKAFEGLGQIIDSVFGEGTVDKIAKFFSEFETSYPVFGVAGVIVETFAETIKRLVATLFGAANAIRIFKIEFVDTTDAIKQFAKGEISFTQLKDALFAEGQSVANAFKVGYEKTLKELSVPTVNADSGEVTTNKNKTTNDTTTQGDPIAEKFKTRAELLKELAKLTKALNAEEAKIPARQRPEFIEKTKKDIQAINELLKEQQKIEFAVVINDQDPNVALEERKSRLNELVLLEEQYKQQRLQGLITEQDLELSLLDIEKQRIDYRLKNAEALKLSEEEIAKLKTRQLEINNEIAKNPIEETLKILKSQEDILRKQRADGVINDTQLEERLIDLRKRSIEQQLNQAKELQLSQEEILKLKADQAELDKQSRANAFNTPINNAAQEALLSYIDNAVAAAGITAFLNALKNGEKVNIALQQSVQATAAAAIVQTFSKKKFAKGVIDLEGEGTETSDSILAWLSRGESVITAKGTDNAPKTLKLINEGKLADTDVLGSLQKGNKQLANYQVQLQNNFALNESRITEAIAKGVDKAVKEKINITTVSVETTKDYLAIVAKEQGKTERTVYENPTKPKKFTGL